MHPNDGKHIAKGKGDCCETEYVGTDAKPSVIKLA